MAVALKNELKNQNGCPINANLIGTFKMKMALNYDYEGKGTKECDNRPALHYRPM